MIRYLILESISPTELMNLIEERLNNGWRLEGGVAVTALKDDDYLYSQAITKSDEDET